MNLQKPAIGGDTVRARFAIDLGNGVAHFDGLAQ
jgi:hypothetical protein